MWTRTVVGCARSQNDSGPGWRAHRFHSQFGNGVIRNFCGCYVIAARLSVVYSCSRLRSAVILRLGARNNREYIIALCSVVGEEEKGILCLVYSVI